jgi:hypothetical protein
MCKNMLLSLNNMNQTIRLMHFADPYACNISAQILQ